LAINTSYWPLNFNFTLIFHWVLFRWNNIKNLLWW